MKKNLVFLLICTMTASCNLNNKTKVNHDEEVVKAATLIVENLKEFTPKKDIDKLMTLYSDSKEFQLIDNEGVPKNYEELKELYSNLFQNLEYMNVLESEVKVYPINEDSAYCIWQGKEEIKMLDSEMMLSSWTGTILVRKLNDSWKIIHFHATHY